MSTVEGRRKYTAADLLVLPDAKQFELVDSQLVERSGSVLAGLVEGILLATLASYCHHRNIALVWPGTLGIRCFPDDPDRVRRPGVSLLRRERFSTEMLAEDFLPVAPDLAGEVLSPSDLAYEIDEKVEEYLRAGISLVWVIDPEARIVYIHRQDGSTAKLRVHDELSGEQIVPGFRCAVNELFPAGGKE